MVATTAEDYNSIDRAIELAIDIYFDGPNGVPVRCTKDNYIMDCSLLDEACADGSTFVGNPSSNELSFTLLGENGRFNPTNTSGPYYGKIKTGVLVVAYIRPIDLAEEVEYEWDQLGVFYITDWQTDVTGITASVTANDEMYYLLNSGMTKLRVLDDVSYEELLEAFLDYNGYAASVIGDLSAHIPFGYITLTNSKFLSEFAAGALVYIFCNHYGNIEVQCIDRDAAVDYELTDADQIVSIKADQSILLEYDGVSLTYNSLYLSDEKNLLTVKDATIGAGVITRYQMQQFSSTPVYAINRAQVISDHVLTLRDVEANAIDVGYTVHNGTSAPSTFAISFDGFTIESLKIAKEDDGISLLKLENAYIQTDEYADYVKQLLSKYISLSVPKLELEVRGNPKYAIGSKLRIVSEAYGVDFTGILVRQKYSYDGGLSATLTVMNSEIVGD